MCGEKSLITFLAGLVFMTVASGSAVAQSSADPLKDECSPSFLAKKDPDQAFQGKAETDQGLKNTLGDNSGLQAASTVCKSSRGLGDFLWSLDVEGPTGDIRCLGVGYDGMYYYVTGAYDFTIAYLHQFHPNGTLMNSFPQPSGNWGSWGWRDLAWDGNFLYAGDDSTMPGYITQIDPSYGSTTGINYGPFPVTPCRALAYDPKSDSFFTGSFGSSIYQCFRDNSYNTYGNSILAGIYGAAMEHCDPANPTLWFWSQDGNGTLASAFDPAGGTFTGDTFEGTTTISGMAGGACAYDTGGGRWELVGLHQAAPDSIAAYDLDTKPKSLFVDVDFIPSWVGGSINFSLDAGPANGGRQYLLLGSLSGSYPGIPLPGGMVVLPVNWDYFSAILLMMPGFLGNLDGSGQAFVPFYVPPCPLTQDITMTFAYALKGPPWDFASNPVEVLVQGKDPTYEYKYDDGSCENILGWTAGGDCCWMHGFETEWVDTISAISTAFGCKDYPGISPGNGTSCTLYIWNDPTNDFYPNDCILLDSINAAVVNVDQDILNKFDLSPSVDVTGVFFVGCNLYHPPGQFAVPIDMDTPYISGRAWVAGDPGGWPGGFDPNVISNNTVTGVSSFFLLRASGSSPPPPPSTVYVDDDNDPSTPGWGYDHFAKIQDGINAVKNNGTVHVKNGTYNENIAIFKTIDLLGEDKTATYIKATVSGDVVTITGYDVYMSGFTVMKSLGAKTSGINICSNSSVISGNRIRENCYGISVSFGSWYALVENNDITSNASHGIYLYGSKNTDVIGNNISQNKGNGIFVESSDLCKITNNDIVSNILHGVEISGTSYDNDISDNNPVSGNYYGIYLHCSNANTVSGNTIDGNRWDGIRIELSGGHSLSGNTVTSNEENGIYLSESDGNTLSGNTITDNYNDGIHLEYSHSNTINNQNTVKSNNDGEGIHLADSNYNTISGNIITQNDDEGILLDASNNNIIDGQNKITWNGWNGVRCSDNSTYNEIIDNEINSNSSSGIRFTNTPASDDHNTVTGNVIKYNDKYGIWIFRSNYNFFSSNTIEYNNDNSSTDEGGIEIENADFNTVIDNSISSNKGIGIWIIGSKGNDISKNTIENNAIDGIRLTHVATDNTFTENNFKDNWDIGLHIYNGDNNTAYHNNFSGNTDHNAYDKGSGNDWDNGVEGNYWDDYSGVDLDGDGIGETPYLIEGNVPPSQDNYPLMDPHQTS